jgi:myo-inositol 2-dehydrogenase/D-chiro-inositol 1-dehydrogenase
MGATHVGLNSASQPMTRRTFVKRIAATAAATGLGPTIVPCSVFGAEGQVAPSSRVTVGMIGLGRQALARNLPVFLRWPDSQVVALCDADRWRLDNTPATPPGAAATHRK